MRCYATCISSYLSTFRDNIYRVIKKSLCTWWSQHTSLLPHYLAQSDCLVADRQGQGDTRLTLTSSVIPNSNYVIMVSDRKCLKYFLRVFCTVIIRCKETFWSSWRFPFSNVKQSKNNSGYASPLKMNPICFPETSLNNYQSPPRNTIT
jgi:hypothetical protein